MIGAFIIAFILSALATVVIRIALVKKIDPESPLLALFAGDRSVFLSRPVLDEASRSEDKITIALHRSYRASQVLVVVLFVVVCVAVAARNLT